MSSHRNFVLKVDVVEITDTLSGKGDNLSLFLFSDSLEVSNIWNWYFEMDISSDNTVVSNQSFSKELYERLRNASTQSSKEYNTRWIICQALMINKTSQTRKVYIECCQYLLLIWCVMIHDKCHNSEIKFCIFFFRCAKGELRCWMRRAPQPTERKPHRKRTNTWKCLILQVSGKSSISMKQKVNDTSSLFWLKHKKYHRYYYFSKSKAR